MNTYVVSLNGKKHTVSIDRDGVATLDGQAIAVDIRCIGGDSYSVLLQGRSIRVVARRNGSNYQVLLGADVFEALVESERDMLLRRYARPHTQQTHRREIRAPMPALVMNIEVTVGETVTSGQGLMVLEAMKMENELKAPQQGKVKEIFVTQGQPVEKGEMLLVLE